MMAILHSEFMHNSTPFQQLLQLYRDEAKTTREQGNYFEKLVIVFLQNDERYAPQFKKIQSYTQWAHENNANGRDCGIDLVATNSDEYGGGFSAIQCKFYKNSTIAKGDIDSFISASDMECFTRRILVDTSPDGLGTIAQGVFKNSSKPSTRITLQNFEDSSIDWSYYLIKSIPDHTPEFTLIKYKPKKLLRKHQQNALDYTKKGFIKQNRGKLIMACGTGKTFTALKIAEELAGKNKRVLFLVPSLALMSQTITEWSIESSIELHSFAVCSDSDVGKRKAKDDDISDINLHDLAYPATTDAKKLFQKNITKYPNKMTVIFSTYQSLDVISRAQKEYGMAAFDLIICDEAHRTTGATLYGETDSEFVKIHDNNFVSGDKRLYMTATPRIYIEQVKTKAIEQQANLYSMDDTDIYGEVFYSLKFGEAVEQELLTDYKVIVLALDSKQVDRDMQKYFQNQDGTLELDDVAKIIGCYKAIIKDYDSGYKTSATNVDHVPMKRVVAFCRRISDSKSLVREFPKVIEAYLAKYQMTDNTGYNISCELEHVDGKMNATEKTKHLNWLKEDTTDICRILSNARCLSEGVDVPSLDAVMFIHGRKSKIDIVQSVGRVMRKAPNKKLGYVIIPVIIPEGKSSEESLAKNSSYTIVWDVLNALRSHDERLDSSINKVDLADDLKSKMEAIYKYVEILAIVDKLPEHKTQNSTNSIGSGGHSQDRGDNDQDTIMDTNTIQNYYQSELNIDSIQSAMLAKIVEKCGTRTYWEDWANDIAEIANKHILRIKTTLDNTESNEYKVFSEFVIQLRNNLNKAISEDEVIEMLAQHIITRPVFNALFSDYNFADNNSISQSMQNVLNQLDKHQIDNEAKTLDKFYESVKRRVNDIDDADAKQKIIIQLYDKFFRNAFPRMTERLGIVYTPVECVDFIIHSVNDVLKQEFHQELGDKNTHIIDPFTGTGTFITRLMQSGLLSSEQLQYKYNLQDKTVNGEKIRATEIHANELVILAYYIASINIEAVYHSIVGGKYKPFEGICLTDTFQLTERDEDLITPQLADNNHRRKIQKKLPIRVFIGNPPYSAGQTSGNDNNQNLKYPRLDKSIKNTYIKFATNTLLNSLYDSYIRAIRWASDRIDKYGVIGFITNAGWINSNSADGLRKCLKDEFSSIYIFHLRGGIRGLNGDQAKKEGQNVFDIMTAVAITILVKNPQAKRQGKIYFYDIGDYLARDAKLTKISSLKSINNITLQGLWQEITPDKYNDWLNQRDDSFYDYIALGNKKDKTKLAIFKNFSLGLKTNRDAWVYNYSKAKLTHNVSNMIDFYNSELERYRNSDAIKNQPKKLADAEKYVANFVNNDSTKIAWTVNIRAMLSKQVMANIEPDNFVCALYRPFTKVTCYFNKYWNERILQLPKIFPEAGIDNLVIGIASIGGNSFSVLISNVIQDLHTLESASQCFPMYLYEPIDNRISLFDSTSDVVMVTAVCGRKYKRTSAITDAGLKHFTDFYNDQSITKEDLFYYIYGLLHSEEYKSKYADNLTKALPHICCVKTIIDFSNFEKAGRKLAKLHLEYEIANLYPNTFTKDITNFEDKDYYVTKMKFAKNAKKDDKTTIIYNAKITLENIPLEAYEYVVNGKSAIEWVMDRQGVVTDKTSGIINNANDFAKEIMNNPKYPLELLQRVITVSIETINIVNNLPNLDI